jgi:hypothetical protein
VPELQASCTRSSNSGGKLSGDRSNSRGEFPGLGGFLEEMVEVVVPFISIPVTNWTHRILKLGLWEVVGFWFVR